MELKNSIYDLNKFLLVQYGIEFSNLKLLETAMTHSSFANESDSRISSNERLEFLGDGILKAALRDLLYNKFSDWDEGKLTKTMAEYESNDYLKKPAKLMKIQDCIFLGNTYKGEVNKDASYITDAFEALIGAIYLDKGFVVTQQFVEKIILVDFDPKKNTDYISSVNIYAQKYDLQLDFQLVEENSGTHENTFLFKVRVGEHTGFGEGSSKQRAKKLACKQIYNILDLGSVLEKQESLTNYKRLIHDYCFDLYNKKAQTYHCIKGDEDEFECRLSIEGESIAIGHGNTERAAKTDAAKKVCKLLNLTD